MKIQENNIAKINIQLFKLSPNITAEMNERGELIGIEILEASSFIRDSILESSQAKILEFKKVG